MINKRLIGLVPEAKNHIKKSVSLQIIALIDNILLIFLLGNTLKQLLNQTITNQNIIILCIAILFLITIRSLCILGYHKENFEASISVKSTIRRKIYEKTEKLGMDYMEILSSAELVQLSSEGVEQLETYFSNYLPQFFYAMLAPIFLFLAIATIHIKVAFVLFLCVPLIPISIVIVQKIAKKLLNKYWDEYTLLGDHFLENLQGLTTLKIYQSDEYMHQKMNQQAEVFRKITMRVLTMQLNSISVMDIMAYGGATLGIVFSLYECSQGNIDYAGVFIIILLSAEFFLPMRLLGSFFHIAMNGMAASKKIFLLLDSPLTQDGVLDFTNGDVEIKQLQYQYVEDQIVLNKITMNIKKNSFVSLVGQSGCGKSTIAGILTRMNKHYQGSVSIDGKELRVIKESHVHKNITLVSAFSYIFKGTIKENLLMANPLATKEQMWDVLKKVHLDQFVLEQNGLEMELLEKGANLSGGQCQRLAIARALLHDSDIYIFDEATSNIDIESEDAILSLIYRMKNTKTIIFITHRLSNVVDSDAIYLMEEGKIVDSGTHDSLLETSDYYQKLWMHQKGEESIKEEMLHV
ncbi:ABC transporter ATP-binding protein/permease [Tannockella kyphosi]|uniref:ABC transporter ATP-binding protein/permease n=1 Tax=Tannockella kyphosi TaxID=2899121 RepID=UPI002012FC32|nr:ABC transporter ATP-binding protein/permease [Tannockella kyphosi]